MSAFNAFILRPMRKAAGLLPMPAFLHAFGGATYGPSEAEPIDHRYCSPAALRWADAAAEYRARGGTLSGADEECFYRVYSALRSGRAATHGQVKQDAENSKWLGAMQRIPELFAREMRSRGVLLYGPDTDQLDDFAGPGSGQELVYKWLFKELGYPNHAAAKTAHNRWKKKANVAKGGTR